MNARITSLLAPRAVGAFLTLAVLALLASPAAAQLSGGVEARTFHVVVDPTGANVHIATVWFGEGESIWRAEDKVDLADMTNEVVLEDQGVSTVPTTLSTSYSSTTLTGTTPLYGVHVFERPSDDAPDLALVLTLESSCSTDCYLDTLDFIMLDGYETNLESPGSVSEFEFGYASLFYGIAGDVRETHTAQ